MNAMNNPFFMERMVGKLHGRGMERKSSPLTLAESTDDIPHGSKVVITLWIMPKDMFL